ncbi:MAG: metalloregulator ArsR/SmtB family transcription factor [Pseudomonadales bacterium]|nr:metalloregulator ArsR/SmtB family transcription factor [Oleiphilus messinensis]MCG8611555.1 metalloregulator ArsR/SmtB family transcription factor [Pseudomonadales bacterium]
MASEICSFLKSLASESRLKILMVFMDGQERTVNQVSEAVGVGQSTCSEHLMILKRAGVVRSEKRGKEVIYSPDRAMITNKLDELSQFLKQCC